MSKQGILLATLALTHCGASCDSRYETQDYTPPADVAEVVQQFALARGKPVRVPVLLLSQPEFEAHGAGAGTVGLCTVTSHGPEVLLQSDYWYRADPAERWALVWHELGHCVLGRDHDAGVAASGCPESLMYPSVTPVGQCITVGNRNALDYANELLGNRAE